MQDGCDGYCTYCIVPKTRPIVQSKPIETVVREAQELVKTGHKEIVVTGIFLGAYGKNTVRRKKWADNDDKKLPKLLEKLSQIPNLSRIRLSSLEPGDVTERLLDVFCERHNIMPHMHLSLQSGSDNILKKMVRQYKIGEFMRKVELIRTRLDRPAITTDLIVGFPGETEADFQQTVEISKEVGFSRMHIFPFSARKGTAAANMQDVLNKEVIKERAAILQELNLELGYKFRQQFIGETAVILTEEINGQCSGHSERYFLTYFNTKGKKLKKNDLVKVKLVENRKDGMVGNIILNSVDSRQ